MKTIERRTFLKDALKGAAALSAAGSGLLLRGCATGKEYDILISGGTVYDGTGRGRRSGPTSASPAGRWPS